MTSRMIAVLIALAAGVATDACAQSQNELIEQRVLPHLEHLFKTLVAERRDTTIDGQRAFTGGDRFLPGKIALGLSLVLVNTPRTDPRFATYLEGYRQIADMTVEDVNETWDVYYSRSSLRRSRSSRGLRVHEFASVPAT